jgi:stage III sporulation protein AD
MDIIAIVGVLVTGAAAAMLLKRCDCGAWSLVSAAASVAAAVFLIRRVSPVSSFISELYCDSGAAGTLIKCLAVSYIAYFASEVCRSAGEDTAAKTALIAGRCEMLLMVLPHIKEIFTSAAEMAGAA